MLPSSGCVLGGLSPHPYQAVSGPSQRVAIHLCAARSGGSLTSAGHTARIPVLYLTAFTGSSRRVPAWELWRVTFSRMEGWRLIDQICILSTLKSAEAKRSSALYMVSLHFRLKKGFIFYFYF